MVTPSACLQQLMVKSYAERELTVPIQICLACDFCDVFELRGYGREQRGFTVRSCTPDGLEAVYRGLDTIDRHTLVRLSGSLREVDEHQLSLELLLAPRQTRRLCLALDFDPSAEPLSSQGSLEVKQSSVPETVFAIPAMPVSQGCQRSWVSRGQCQEFSMLQRSRTCCSRALAAVLKLVT